MIVADADSAVRSKKISKCSSGLLSICLSAACVGICFRIRSCPQIESPSMTVWQVLINCRTTHPVNSKVKIFIQACSQ